MYLKNNTSARTVIGSGLGSFGSEKGQAVGHFECYNGPLGLAHKMWGGGRGGMLTG